VYKVSPAQPFDALFRVEPLTADEAKVNQPVNIRIRVSAPQGIKWIRLYYRAVNQQLEFKNLPMEPDATPGQYRAVIPVADIDTTYDLMYYIELMDKGGHGRIFPDLDKETPYKIIKWKASDRVRRNRGPYYRLSS